MTTSIDELYDRAMALSSDVEDKFLELGRSLRQLLDRDPGLFQQVVKKRGLGRRKAYYLVEVSRKIRAPADQPGEAQEDRMDEASNHRPARDEGQRRGTRQHGRAIKDKAA